jgi:hypothetical protein
VRKQQEVVIPVGWRDRYLTVAQAALIGNFTPHALYNKIHRGEGPRYFKQGFSVRIFGGDLEMWLRGDGAEAGTVGSQTDSDHPQEGAKP